MTLWTARREFLKTPIHTCRATASADHVILVGVNMNFLIIFPPAGVQLLIYIIRDVTLIGIDSAIAPFTQNRQAPARDAHV